jgi:D-amino-acid oxidase
VRLAPAVVVGALPTGGEMPPRARIIPELRRCTDDELPPGFDSGFHSRMPLMDMPRYLDYLERRLVAAGGEVEQRRVRTLSEAVEAAPVVMNCTALGARELASDRTVTPVFGQHVITGGRETRL